MLKTLQVECPNIAAVSEDFSAVHIKQPRFGQAYNFSLFAIEKSVVEDLFQLILFELLKFASAASASASSTGAILTRRLDPPITMG